MTLARLGLLFTLSVLPLAAQAVARQGTEADLKQGEFTSPMVLELPLERLKAEEPGGVYPFTDQAKFVCDGVNLPLVLITKSTTWSKRIKLTIRASACVRPSYDRKVRIQCTLVGGAQAQTSLTELEISAKEKQHRSDSGTLELSKEAFESLFTGDTPGRLKLVVSVAPDR